MGSSDIVVLQALVLYLVSRKSAFEDKRLTKSSSRCARTSTLGRCGLYLVSQVEWHREWASIAMAPFSDYHLSRRRCAVGCGGN